LLPTYLLVSGMAPPLCTAIGIEVRADAHFEAILNQWCTHCFEELSRTEAGMVAIHLQQVATLSLRLAREAEHVCSGRFMVPCPMYEEDGSASPEELCRMLRAELQDIGATKSHLEECSRLQDALKKADQQIAELQGAQDRTPVHAANCSHTDSSFEGEELLSGRRRQRVEAVEQLERKGVNMRGVNIGMTPRRGEACSPKTATPAPEESPQCHQPAQPRRPQPLVRSGKENSARILGVGKESCPKTPGRCKENCPKTLGGSKENCTRTPGATKENCPKTPGGTKDSCAKTPRVAKENCTRTLVATKENCARSDTCPKSGVPLQKRQPSQRQGLADMTNLCDASTSSLGDEMKGRKEMLSEYLREKKRNGIR